MRLNFKSVKIQKDKNTIKISSKPSFYYIVFFIAGLIGLFSLPHSEYRHDYFAYMGLIFVLVLTSYYFVTCLQETVFENKTNITVKKGFKKWNIPFEVVSGGYTSYKKFTSQASLERTHYLNFELKVNLPNNSNHWIRNGHANVFRYGFNEWGDEQNKIWDELNAILNEKGIPNQTPE